MKSRLLFLLVIVLLVFGSGCGLFSRAAEKPPAGESTASAKSTTPALAPSAAPATAAPEQPTAAPEQPAAAPTAAPTQTPAATAAPVEPAGPVNRLPEAQPGPETLDLDDPAIYTIPLSDYTARLDDTIDGQGPDGSAAQLINRYATRYQTQPAAGWYNEQAIFDESTLVVSALVDNVRYSSSGDGQCTTSTEPGATPANPMAALQGALTGQASLAEAGVEINGLEADRYEIGAENIAPGGELVLKDEYQDGESSGSSSTTVKLHGAGSLYLARQGGFVLRLELADAMEAGEDDAIFFQPGSEMTSQTIVELLPTAPDEAPIAPPEACGGGAGGDMGGGDQDGSDMGGGVSIADLPRPDDAEVMVEDAGQLVYQSAQAPAELAAFYKDELEALGWTLDNSTNLGTIATLTFSSGDQSLTITIMQTSGTSMVTLSLD
ncbi:MAG: hypothetical protein ACKOC5_18325 [Chloroflexota bacterium]